MRDAVEKLIKSFVDNPDAVVISERQDRSSTIIEVRVAGSDMGKIIGREGRTVKALRSLLHAASQKQAHRYVLDIVE